MRRLRFRLMLIAALVVLILAAAGGFFLYQVRHIPEFYEQAIAIEPHEQVAAGQQFEQQALEVQNQLRRIGPWRAEITEDEINGWLATVLPEKFPNALPPEAREPRVALRQDRILIAAKYRTSGIESVVSLELSAFLTEKPNVVAVRVHRAAAGNIPLPLGKYLEEITAVAAKRGVYIGWQEIEGDPLAIVTLPLAEPGDRRVIATGTAEERGPAKKATAPAEPNS
jgi:hypothetical protein